MFPDGDGSWVFINNELVVGIGGVRSASEQTAHPDRRDCLRDNIIHSLRFIFTEPRWTRTPRNQDHAEPGIAGPPLSMAPGGR